MSARSGRQPKGRQMKRPRSPFEPIHFFLCIASAFLLTACAAPDIRKEAAAELAATGKLRAAINFGNPTLAVKDPSGEPRGVSVDLAREAARRLGVPVELVQFDSAGKVVE